MHLDSNEKIGQRVKQYRIQRGLSQDELAEGICSRQTISLLENGKHFPSADFMQKIADRLSLPLHEILIDETRELEDKIQLDIVRVYIERGEYKQATPIIEHLFLRDTLLEYQRQELILCNAECLMRTGDATKAIEQLISLQSSLERLQETDKSLLAKVHNKLGTAYFFVSDMVNAYANYHRAYQLSLYFPQFDLTAAQISYNMGKISSIMRLPKESLDYYTSAMKFFEESSNLVNLAHVMFNLAIVYKDLKELDMAKEYLEKSLALYESVKTVNLARQVRQQYAFYILSETEPELATDELVRCASEFEAEKELVWAAYTYARAASLFLKNKEITSARGFLDRAFELFAEVPSLDTPDYAYVLRINAEYFLEVKDYDKIIEYSYMSANLFDKMGLARDAAEALQVAGRVFRERNMFQKADEVSQRIIKILCHAHDKFYFTPGGE